MLDKYFLTKIGNFPDCYERIANHFFKQKNELSALVTCERALSVFYGWGHTSFFHSQMLSSIPERDKEVRFIQ